jgi:hypothetical protein
MEVGIIAEGPADVAVIMNILKGKLGLDRSDMYPIRPELSTDETDLHAPGAERFSNWAIVRDECIDGRKIGAFLSLFADDCLVVIHIDTAEAELAGYDVKRPGRQEPDYCAKLRQAVAHKIDAWLKGRFLFHIRHAIAVEETDAWVLTTLSNKETSSRPDPKKDLKNALNKNLGDKERKKLFQLGAYEQYDKLSEPFRKRKTLDEHARKNHSLRVFVDSL